jgi:hypothetical protein
VLGSSAEGDVGEDVGEEVKEVDERGLGNEEAGNRIDSEKDVKVVVGSVTVVIGIRVVIESLGPPKRVSVTVGTELNVIEESTTFPVVVSLGGGIEVKGVVLEVVATGSVLLRLWRFGGGSSPSSLGRARCRKKLVVVVMTWTPFRGVYGSEGGYPRDSGELESWSSKTKLASKSEQESRTPITPKW